MLYVALKCNILWNKIFENCVYFHSIEKVVSTVQLSFFSEYESKNVPITYIESLIQTYADFQLPIATLGYSNRK